MNESRQASPVSQIVEELYRTQSRRIFATLIRLLGDFERAEEALHEAFALAVEQWPVAGIPENPRAWLVSAGRFKSIDALRRRVRLEEKLPQLVQRGQTNSVDTQLSDDTVEDDQLRLIFTCCHPALADTTQVALTLREVCGLKTEEIASAFLTSPTTVAQRIVRGKTKIRDAGIPYVIPVIEELPERLDSVLSVIYLVFNEGYSASAGESVTRLELSGEAIRLGRLLVELLPQSETLGLLALMLLQESRRQARTTLQGDLVLLEDQDRAQWDRSAIGEGTELVRQAFQLEPVGEYAIQAAIAAVHANSPTASATDWGQIVSLYDLLLQAAPGAVVELNRAVAVAMRDGPAAGLDCLDPLLDSPELARYHLAHAARADLCRRLERTAEAVSAYRVALSLARQEPERRFLEKRLRELSGDHS